MPTAYTTFEDEVKKLINPNREKALQDSDAFYNSQITSTNKLYDAETEKAGKAYDDSYRENAVQKLINERQVAENMANLGLTNSGLNRTQQTAVQLSYANQKANLDRQRQSTLDDINLTRSQAIDTIEQNRASSAMKINQEYDNLINETAATNYNNYLDYITESTKSSGGGASPKITKFDYGTPVTLSYSSNGNWQYTDKNGNSVKMRAGANPYNGKVNADLLSNGKYDASLAFSNGYQPNNINGTPLKESGATIELPGTKKPRNVWEANGKYYYWDGFKNQYIKLTNAEKKELGLD